jgi:hypothetical protein
VRLSGERRRGFVTNSTVSSRFVADRSHRAPGEEAPVELYSRIAGVSLHGKALWSFTVA